MIAGLILAGGEARRMGGGDKTLRRLGGITLLEHVATRLRPQTDRLAISANGDPARFAGFALTVLADGIARAGPLGGILRGLDWAACLGADALLTVPGDTPFIPDDLAARLLPAPAVAASQGRVHHAVALWPVSCRAGLRAHLQAPGDRALAGFARSLTMRMVEFAAAPFDPFFNINRPEDLERALMMMMSAPSPPGPTPG